MKILVQDQMTPQLTTVLWNENLLAAFKKMQQAKIRHLPVIDESKHVVGMLSDRDLQRAMHVNFDERIPVARFDQGAVVRDFMSQPAQTVSVTASISDAATKMIEAKISALLVLKGDTVTGIITHEDLLAVLVLLLDEPKSGIKSELEKIRYNTTVAGVLNLLSSAGL